MAVTDPRKTGFQALPYAGAYTYATLPSASTYSGYQALASDIGTNGTVMVSNGVRWRPLNGSANLKDLGAPVSGIGTTETIVMQTLLPIGAWQVNDTIRLWFQVNKSGSTDASVTRVRIGTGGTITDNILTGGNPVLAAANLSAGIIWDVKLITSTSATKVGPSGAQGSYGGALSVAQVSASTVPDTTANAVYISLCHFSAGATDTVGIQSGQIQLVTP